MGIDLNDYACALAALGVLESRGTEQHPASPDPYEIATALATGAGLGAVHYVPGLLPAPDTAALEAAIRPPDPFYEELGVCDGETWKQLNACLLQTESEFYAPIRPKRIGLRGERPAIAPSMTPSRVRMPARNTAVRIGSTPVDTTVAIALAASWKPLM